MHVQLGRESNLDVTHALSDIVLSEFISGTLESLCSLERSNREIEPSEVVNQRVVAGLEHLFPGSPSSVVLGNSGLIPCQFDERRDPKGTRRGARGGPSLAVRESVHL